MFKNKELRVTLDKKGTDVPTIQDEKTFEQKVKVVFHHVERIGVKLFVGVCVYVLLDTIRQVEVEKIRNQD